MTILFPCSLLMVAAVCFALGAHSRLESAVWIAASLSMAFILWRYR